MLKTVMTRQINRMACVFLAAAIALLARAAPAANSAAPGDGLRGRLEPYAENAELKSLMSRYGGMSAGWYRREVRPAAAGDVQPGGADRPRRRSGLAMSFPIEWVCRYE